MNPSSGSGSLAGLPQRKAGWSQAPAMSQQAGRLAVKSILRPDCIPQGWGRSQEGGGAPAAPQIPAAPSLSSALHTPFPALLLPLPHPASQASQINTLKIYLYIIAACPAHSPTPRLPHLPPSPSDTPRLKRLGFIFVHSNTRHNRAFCLFVCLFCPPTLCPSLWHTVGAQ